MVRLVIPASTSAKLLVPQHPLNQASVEQGYLHIPGSDIVECGLLAELQAAFGGAFDIFRGKVANGVVMQFDGRVNPADLRAWLVKKGFKTRMDEVSGAILASFRNRHLGVAAHIH